MAERPIDVLDEAKGKRILVRLKNGNEVTGTLRALDMHLNLWLDDVEIKQGEQRIRLEKVLIRGDNILYASPV
jgi:small nuclear ribonucleoprotein